MKRRFALRASAALAAAALSGCSTLFGPEGFFRDRGDDYLKADVINAMRVPEGVEQRSVDQLYVIPSISEEAQQAGLFEVPRPQSLSENAFTDRVKIQKLEDKRWILVSATPAAVWPQVRGFLSRNNLEVAYTDAATGIIETGWLKFVNDEETLNKYRMRIEQGIQPESTEIHVLHLSVASDTSPTGNPEWPARSSSAERESWMVDELAGTIASDAASSQAASLMAQSIGLSNKVVIDTAGSEPVLRLAVARNRALATVTHALNRGGFSLWEQDSTSGLFYVTFDENYVADEEEEPGFFGRLLGREPAQPTPPPYTLAQLLAHLQAEDNELNRQLFAAAERGESLPDAPGYLVVLHGSNGAIEVRIRDAYGRDLAKKDAKRLLSDIRQNLI